MLIRRDLDEGTVVPWGYGFAYLDPLRRTAVFWVWPLNWVVAVLRWGWWKLRDAPRRSEDFRVLGAIQDARREGYEAGYKANCTAFAAYDDGFFAGRAAERKRINDALDALFAGKGIGWRSGSTFGSLGASLW